jgi:hypothetical protein
MAFKSALTVASIALIATASSLAMAAPSEARDGCGRGFKFSNRHGQCVLKNKFRPVVVNPRFHPVVDGCGRGFKFSNRVGQCVLKNKFRPVIVNPRFHPVVVNPMIHPDMNVFQPVVANPMLQPDINVFHPVVVNPMLQPFNRIHKEAIFNQRIHHQSHNKYTQVTY